MKVSGKIKFARMDEIMMSQQKAPPIGSPTVLTPNEEQKNE